MAIIKIKDRAEIYILQSWVGYFEPTLTWFPENPFLKLPKSWSEYVNLVSRMMTDVSPRAAAAASTMVEVYNLLRKEGCERPTFRILREIAYVEKFVG
jgi:hypothetical protein